MRYLLLLFVWAGLPPLAAAQAEGLSLVGRLNPRPEGYADVWGYVGPDGREYALVNARRGAGLSVIDVTQPPYVEVGFVPGNVTNGVGSDVEVYGHYAYVSDDRSPVQIVDLADPRQPVLAATFEADPGDFSAGVHTLTIDGDYLYTQGGGGVGGVRIFSLANPLAPQLVGEYQPHYVHDILVRGDTLYTMGIYGTGVDIVDLSDRSQPELISRFNYPGSGVHNACGTDSGYLFVGDEIGTGRWTRVFDVRDPHNVELVAEIVVDAASTVHNCHLLNDRLYLAHYDRGAWVYDVSDPRAPVELAHYETDVSLMWSVYPHLPSGNLIASDMQQGLFVLRLNSIVADEPAPGSGADVALTASPNPVSDLAQIRFRLDRALDVTVAVYDVLGRRVATVADGPLAAGEHTRPFRAAAHPPGVYVVRLTTAGASVHQALTVAR